MNGLNGRVERLEQQLNPGCPGCGDWPPVRIEDAAGNWLGGRPGRDCPAGCGREWLLRVYDVAPLPE